jgi:hypothetical protein
MFASLPERIAPLAAAWGFEPMFAEFWNEVMRQAKRTNLIGERFAVARRAMERRFGIVPLEVPMSRICETNLFIYFLSLILNELESFQAIYNDAVHVYRQEHGIRSRNHPVPDLVNDGDWLETPFWAWRKGQARRHKLYVRKAPREWFMRFGDEQVSMRWEGVDAEVLEKLFAEGFKIRTRALTTTMFARMFLADLFIHGIGGGIYDALTDRIIERFFNVAAPGYMAVSATLLLPLPRYPDAAEQARLLQRKVRDLTYQPERFVVPNVEVDALLRAKKDWIKRNGTTHAERVERYEQIRAINSQLQPHVALELQRTLAALEQSKLQIKRHEVAAQRDYAFCLYPAEMLCEFFFQNPQESLRSS